MLVIGAGVVGLAGQARSGLPHRYTDTPAPHGVPHLVQMFGIESPGLTSSLSLAETVVTALD